MDAVDYETMGVPVSGLRFYRVCEMGMIHGQAHKDMLNRFGVSYRP